MLLEGGLRAESGVGAAVLAMPLSVRQMGMGNVTMGGRDMLRAWTNPAVLADQETTGEASVNGASMFQGQQKNGGLGVGWRMTPQWVVGGLLAYHTLSVPEIDALGNQLASDLSQETIAAGVTSALSTGPFRIGATLKAVSESLVQNRATTAALDIGFMGVLAASSARIMTIGVSVRNIGPNLRRIDDANLTAVLPREMRAGFSYAYQPWGLSVGLEYTKPVKLDAGIGVGIDWWPIRSLGLRAGVADVGTPDGLRYTVGISGAYQKQGIGVDYALVTHPLGATNRFSLSYMFGGRTVEPVASGLESHDVTTPATAVPAAGAGARRADAEYRGAVSLYNAGDYDGAWRKAYAALQAHPQHWQSWMMIGNCQYAKGDRQGALVSYQRSLAIHPDNPRLKAWVEQLKNQ